MAVPFETNILIHTQGGIVTRAAKDKQNEWQEARIVRKNTSDNVANLAQLGLIAEHSRVAEGAASPARVQIWNEAIQRFYLEHEPSIVMYLNVCTCGLPLCECSLEEPRDASRQLLTDVGPKPILRPVDGRHRRQVSLCLSKSLLLRQSETCPPNEQAPVRLCIARQATSEEHSGADKIMGGAKNHTVRLQICTPPLWYC